MRRILFSFLLFSTLLEALPCECIERNPLEYFLKADFIATVEMLKISEDSTGEMHFAEIKTIETFKGPKLEKINIYSELNTSCGFLPVENSKWLIIAYKNKNGKYGFGYCSGSRQLNRILSEERAKSNYDASIALQVSSFRSFRGIRKLLNKEHARIPGLIMVSGCDIPQLESLDNNGRFAVFEIELTKDFSIKSIKTIKGFGDKKLNSLVENYLSKALKIRSLEESKLIKKKYLIDFYYYPPEEGHKGFISQYFL